MKYSFTSVTTLPASQWQRLEKEIIKYVFNAVRYNVHVATFLSSLVSNSTHAWMSMDSGPIRVSYHNSGWECATQFCTLTLFQRKKAIFIPYFSGAKSHFSYHDLIVKQHMTYSTRTVISLHFHDTCLTNASPLFRANCYMYIHTTDIQ